MSNTMTTQTTGEADKLRLSSGETIAITKQQAEAIARVIRLHDKAPDMIATGFCEGTTIILVFPFITIGIEPDGYAHS